MFQRLSPLSAVLAFTFLLSTPLDVLARGGGGGGGHGGGGGGGHFAGGGARFGGGWGGRGYGWGGYRGYGWGGYRGYGWGYRGWGGGYPYYGYGLGLGLGMGLGYGLAGGYSGGYGYGGYGYGYPGYGYYGYGYGYDPYAAGYGGTYGPAPYAGPTPPSSAPSSAVASPTAQSDAATLEAGREFADKGQAAFKAGDYQGAVYALRHATVDDPRNPVVTLLLGQALFATGQFDEAAGATQAAMRQLPSEKWGVVINHYTELYGNSRDYTNQLRALERRVKEKPDDPALRFLAGFHYAYLGFTAQAMDQLDKVAKIAPRDEMARQLREELRGKLGKPTVAPVPPAPAISDEPQGPALEQ